MTIDSLGLLSPGSLKRMEAFLLSDYLGALEKITSEGDENLFLLLMEALARGGKNTLKGLELTPCPEDKRLRKLARQHGSATAQMFSKSTWNSGNLHSVIPKFTSNIDPALGNFAMALSAVSGLLLDIHEQASNMGGGELTSEEKAFWYAMLPKITEWISMLWEVLSGADEPLAPDNQTGEVIYSIFIAQALSHVSLIFGVESQKDDTAFISARENYQRSAAAQIAFLGWMRAINYLKTDAWFGIMKFFGKGSEKFPIKAALVDDSVRRYGTAPIIARLSSILRLNDGDADFQRLPMCAAFLASISHNTPFRSAIGASEFAVEAIRDAWRLVSEYHKYDDMPSGRETIIMSATIFIHDLLKIIGNGPKFLVLVLSEDLLSLVARLFYLSILHEMECRRTMKDTATFMAVIQSQLQEITTKICSFIPKPAMESVRQKLRPIFLRTLDALQGLEASTYLNLMVLQWKAIGQSVGINEESMRQALRDVLAAEPLTGCYWEKCVLFGVRTHLKFLICERCGNAQYCDVEPCQKRDWHDGRHKAICGIRKVN